MNKQQDNSQTNEGIKPNSNNLAIIELSIYEDTFFGRANKRKLAIITAPISYAKVFYALSELSDYAITESEYETLLEDKYVNLVSATDQSVHLTLHSDPVVR